MVFVLIEENTEKKADLLCNNKGFINKTFIF